MSNPSDIDYEESHEDYVRTIMNRRDKYEVARQKFLEKVKPWMDTKMNLYETCNPSPKEIRESRQHFNNMSRHHGRKK